MKKVILISIAVFTFIFCDGQNYPPFINNTCWYANEFYYQINKDFWVIPKNDTVISSLTYKNFIDSASGQVIAIIREDIPNKKVFKYFNNSEVVMYDFSLQMTDTITLFNGLNYVVDSIDSISVANGNKRRSLRLNHYLGSSIVTSEYWVEGVGNLGYPLRQNFELSSDPVYHINCSYQNGVNIFNYGIASGQSQTNCPSPPFVGINQISFSENTVIYPNPFSKKTVLKTDVSFQKATLSLYNYLGIKVKQIKNITGYEITILRDNLPAGLYFLSLTEEDKFFTSKLIIIDK